MSAAQPEEYTAFLCHMTDGVPVPYEKKPIAANNDEEAKRKANEWVATITDLIDEGTWLFVKQGGRSIHSVKLAMP